MENKNSILEISGMIALILGCMGTLIFVYSFIYIMRSGEVSIPPFFSAALVLFAPAPFLVGTGIGALKKRKYAAVFNRIAQGITLLVVIVLVVLHIEALSHKRSEYFFENIRLHFGYFLKHISGHLILFFLLSWFAQYLWKEKDRFEPPSPNDTDQTLVGFTDSVSYFLEKTSRQKRETMMRMEQGRGSDPLENFFAGLAVFAGAVGTLFFSYGLFTVINCTLFTSGGCHLGHAFGCRCAVIFLSAPFILVGGMGILEGRSYGLKYLFAGWMLCVLVFIVSLGMSLRNGILLGQILLAGLFTVLPLGLFLYYSKKKRKKKQDEFADIRAQLRDVESKVKYYENEDK